MSSVRKDRASFKVDNQYFFMKTLRCFYDGRFHAMRVNDYGLLCHMERYSDVPFSNDVQKAYQTWCVEILLLGEER